MTSEAMAGSVPAGQSEAVPEELWQAVDESTMTQPEPVETTLAATTLGMTAFEAEARAEVLARTEESLSRAEDEAIESLSPAERAEIASALAMPQARTEAVAPKSAARELTIDPRLVALAGSFALLLLVGLAVWTIPAPVIGPESSVSQVVAQLGAFLMRLGLLLGTFALVAAVVMAVQAAVTAPHSADEAPAELAAFDARHTLAALVRSLPGIVLLVGVVAAGLIATATLLLIGGAG